MVIGRGTWVSALVATTALTATFGEARAQAADASESQPSPAVASAVVVPPKATPAAASTQAEPNPGEGAGGKKPATLSEIVVTADRKNSFSADYVQAGSFRGARNLDTPLTINVITGEVLKSQQAIDLIDALRNTAGVSSNSNGPAVYNNITIRGIIVDTRSNFRLDGSLPIISSIAFPLEDKDRVEVLKGASALYYGFSNPAGIVNLTMKRPTSEPLLSATAFGDSHGGGGGAVDASDTWTGPYGKFGARVNGLFADIDDGVKYSTGHRYMISGAFDWKPIDRLTFSLDVENFEKNIVEPATFRFSSAPTATPANPFPALALPPLLNPSSNFGPNWASNDATETNVLGKMTYKFNDAWSFTTDAGVSHLNRFRYLPTFAPTNVATGAGTLTISPQDAIFTTVSYRAEIDGTFYTGPLLHEVMIGAQRAIKDSFAPVAKKLNFADNFFTPISIAQPATPKFTADTTRIDDQGLYFFDRVKITDWLQVLGGVRQSHYTESDKTLGQDTFGPDTPLSYSYGGILKPVPWASIYGTYIEGLETTVVAPSTAVNANAQLGPTMSQQKEYGLKIEPRRGLIFQVAYFDITRGSTYVNSANVYVLDGQAEYKGEELSLTGEVNRDLSIYASATFLSAKQISAAATVSSPIFTPSIAGKRIEGTPETTASVSGEYKLPFYRAVSLTAGVYYTGNQAINANNNAFIPAYTTFDLGAAYQREIAGHPTVFRVNAQNVANTRYWAATGGLFLGESLPGVVKFSISTTY